MDIEQGDDDPFTEEGLFIETVAVFVLPANTDVIVLLPTVLPLAIVVTIPVEYVVPGVL